METGTWREKLEALAKLPRPTGSRYFPRAGFPPPRVPLPSPEPPALLPLSFPLPLPAPVTMAITPGVPGAPPGTLLVNQRPIKLKLCHRKDEDGQEQGQDGVARTPDCLNTFSDFFNPKVSAEERFEKYLHEMHRQEQLKWLQVVPPGGRSARYEAGSRGGGWRVLPRISNQRSSNFNNRLAVSASLELEEERRQRLGGFGSSTTR